MLLVVRGVECFESSVHLIINGKEISGHGQFQHAVDIAGESGQGHAIGLLAHFEQRLYTSHTQVRHIPHAEHYSGHIPLLKQLIELCFEDLSTISIEAAAQRKNCNVTHHLGSNLEVVCIRKIYFQVFRGHQNFGGGIAQVLAQSLTDKGYRQIIIENGGDLYLSRQKRKRVIGVFAGSSKFSRRIALEIKPSQTPCGICASSASFGHSLSFGEADCAVILAKDAALADAAATAVCNLIKSTDNFKHGIEFSKKIPGIFGVLIVLGNSLASWGDIQIKKLN